MFYRVTAILGLTSGTEMGNYFARLTKTKTTVGILQEIETLTKRLLKYKHEDQQYEEKFKYLVLFLILFFVILGLFYHIVSSSSIFVEIGVIFCLLFLLGSLLIVIKLLQWYINHTIKLYDTHLEDLRKKKKQILEEVKEMESYEKAIEILERFDPFHLLHLQTAACLREQTKRAEMFTGTCRQCRAHIDKFRTVVFDGESVAFRCVYCNYLNREEEAM